MRTSRSLTTRVMVSLLFLSCARQRADHFVKIRVFSDQSAEIGERVVAAEHKFNLAMQQKSPHDRPLLSFYVNRSYREGLQKLSIFPAQVVILNQEADLAEVGEVGKRFGKPEYVCGLPAYIPDWTSAEERGGAQAFLKTLEAVCGPDAQRH